MLAVILKQLLTPDVHLVAFNDEVVELKHGAPLPDPGGSTALHLALDYAAELSPQRVIILSDGEPDSAEAAFAAPRALCCVISTFYCGDESDRPALAFMKRLTLLSRGGVGRPQLADLNKPQEVTTKLRLLLAPP